MLAVANESSRSGRKIQPIRLNPLAAPMSASRPILDASAQRQSSQLRTFRFDVPFMLANVKNLLLLGEADLR